MITNFFIPELNNHDVQELWFQQDGATRHTARATIDLLKDTFGDHLISRFELVNWPPRSCDLTPLDYFLWGYVKSFVYVDKPQTLDHLEDNICRVISDIRPQMLEKVIENWTSRLDYIRASRGSHMPEIIFKISETSTNHQLLRLTNRVINGFNSGDTTGGAFLDVEKAFDRVWHDRLIFKMIKLNFPSYMIHLINSYLNDRTFQVKILTTLSRIGTVSAESPQGLNLSPMLYNIYTHVFPTTPTVDVCLFADDAAIIAQACNPDMVRRYLQQYLKKLQSWL
ncbi:RNA-directed DNA polymerase from mobile element jockey [Trichonephila clavipes]|nr:RNA-directed DNA polymerase from mobile element jockey [Trichonephila clavipes]